MESTAKITGTTNKLKLKRQTSKEAVEEEKLAEAIEESNRTRKPNFSFQKCGICPGSTIVFTNDASITCTVVDDRKVEYNGTTYYLSALASELLEKDNIPGTHYFTFNGKLLKDIDSLIDSNKPI